MNYETTDDILEGDVNKFFSDQRCKDALLGQCVTGDILAVNGDKLERSGLFIYNNVVMASERPIQFGHREIDLTGDKRFTWDLKYTNITIKTDKPVWILRPENMRQGSWHTMIIEHESDESKLHFSHEFLFTGGVLRLSKKKGRIDILHFYCDGFNMYGKLEKNFMPRREIYEKKDIT